MRIAMIGMGDIARKAYLPLVANTPDITPILCTRSPQTLERLSAQYRIEETHTELQSLLASRPDAAMIHSSTSSHASLAEQLLEAGIPTFVDKPLGYHQDECERLCNLAEQKQVPLMVGFNRRYAPLIEPLNEQAPPTQLHLQKNRPDLPDEPRVFVYDDFIHVLDTLRFLAPGDVENLRVSAYGQPGSVGVISAQWLSGDTLVTASMNRLCGVSEERLEFFGDREKWQIDNLSGGWHHVDNQAYNLAFGDWEHTLYKRGFVNMVEAWYEQVDSGELGDFADIFATHSLCEHIVQQVEPLLL